MHPNKIHDSVACDVVFRVLLTEIYWKWLKTNSAAGPTVIPTW